MLYRFDGFDFDPDNGLERDGEPVALEPLAHELLHYLLRNRGRVVGRDELNETLWDGRIVSDAALSTQVRSVRRALGDDRLQQKFVKTHPRRGFSFAAAVEEVDAAQGPAGQPLARTEASETAPIAAAATAARGAERRGPVILWSIVGALVLALLVATGTWITREAAVTDGPAARSLSIAVLPFDNLSGDPSKDYLADAFTEDLVIDLSRIRDAFVISRSTTFTYRGKDVDAATVAKELGVRYVVEGSVRVDGDAVRVNAQLIDGNTNSPLWSDRFERTLANLFDVRDNVTGRIASVLRAELRVADSKRQEPQAANDAWEFALKGNVILYNHQSIADYQEAYRLLNEAVSLDPSISSAWGGLAFVHLVASSANVPGVSQPNSAELWLDAALKAVQADPLNAEPYWLVGAGYARNGQPERGMSACDMAMDLNPNMDCGHVCAGLVHLAQGEPDKAVPYFQYALKLNPLFRPFTKEKYLGLAYLQSGQDDLAIAALNRALAKAPKDGFANLALVSALALDGRETEARAALDRYQQMTERELPTIAALRTSIGWMGPQVERMLQGLRDVGVAEA